MVGNMGHNIYQSWEECLSNHVVFSTWVESTNPKCIYVCQQFFWNFESCSRLHYTSKLFFRCHPIVHGHTLGVMFSEFPILCTGEGSLYGSRDQIYDFFCFTLRIGYSWIRKYKKVPLFPFLPPLDQIFIIIKYFYPQYPTPPAPHLSPLDQILPP